MSHALIAALSDRLDAAGIDAHACVFHPGAVDSQMGDNLAPWLASETCERTWLLVEALVCRALQVDALPLLVASPLPPPSDTAIFHTPPHHDETHDFDESELGPLSFAFAPLSFAMMLAMMALASALTPGASPNINRRAMIMAGPAAALFARPTAPASASYASTWRYSNTLRLRSGMRPACLAAHCTPHPRPPGSLTSHMDSNTAAAVTQAAQTQQTWEPTGHAKERAVYESIEAELNEKRRFREDAGELGKKRRH